MTRRLTWTPRSGKERAEDELAARQVTRWAYAIPIFGLTVPAAVLLGVIWAVTR